MDDAGGPASSVQFSQKHFSSYDIDDAFTDDDDADLSFQFSPDAIREEMARTMAHVDDASHNVQKPHTNGLFSGHDSVSTLDMNGDTDQASPATSSSGSLSPVDMSPQFVSISLSRSQSGPTAEEEPTNDHDDATDDTSDHSAHSATPSESEYPAVHIDTSQPPSHRVTLSADSQASADSRVSHTDPSSPRPSSELPGRPSSSRSVPLPERLSTDHGEPSSSTLSPATAATAVAASASANSLNLTQKPGHRPTRSVGPSALEKVMSKTRPSFLPPKPKQEDNKHMADWEKMMKQSRAAAEERRKEREKRRLLREKKIEESLHIWEREILPDWRVVHKNPALRKLWWKGIPAKLRSTMWERAVGNPLALSKDTYRTCLSRAKRALAAGTFPAATLDLIEQDVSNILPSVHIFDPKNGPLHPDLKDMLYAWVVARSDEGLGYTLGAARIAGMLLLNLLPPQAFVVMRNLLERHCLRSFFGGEGSKADVEAYYRIFDTLLADGMPKIYFNFKQHHISPAAYLPDWLIPLFLDHLPFEACARIWDVLILEGDSFLYRAALGILAVLEPRLFFPEKKELLELLKGENKAAIDVAIRENARLDGGKYEIYGVDEETLWERIDAMDDWWKESTWTRLIQRELPDL